MWRAILIAAAVLISPAAHASSPGAATFEIFMNGRPVGTHSVTVTRDGAAARADVRIDMSGKVGPFSFTYAHRCTETWTGSALSSMACEDREGRKVKTVQAQRTAAGLLVRTPAGDTAVAPTLIPSSWWRSETAQATRLIDTRNGKALPVKIKAVGSETVQTTAGPVTATRYQITGSTKADIWYDTTGRWVKMAFRLRGQSFEYRLLTAPDAAPRA